MSLSSGKSFSQSAWRGRTIFVLPLIEELITKSDHEAQNFVIYISDDLKGDTYERDILSRLADALKLWLAIGIYLDMIGFKNHGCLFYCL